MDKLSRALADRYESLSEVGCGGFATVYAARDRRHGSRVAIKVLRPELAAAFGGMRFAREVEITAGLQHPHILPLLDSGEANGIPYYVMPFVDGESLAERMQRESPLPIDEAVRLVAEVADGLHYAHARGFVHRDIKPANILLSQGHAVLADFGVARALDVTGADRITASGMALGTVTYMSPEQAAGEHVDGRADVYALACVLYEALAGAPPFSGPSAQAIMARHAIDTAPSIRTIRQTVPEALEAVIMRALAKVPTDRHATAAQFRDDVIRAAAMPVSSTLLRAPARGAARRRAAMAGWVILGVATVATVWRWALPEHATLDPNRVTVYPLVLPPDWNGSRATGEDVATMIGNAVDGAGSLRWIDGWQLLGAAQRENVRTLTNEEAVALARRQRSARMLTGRIVMRGDSADVFLEMRDVEGDSVLSRHRATASLHDVWRAGLGATTQLLPQLIRTGVPDVATEWTVRNPTAVAHFLAGESAFRRVQLEAAEEEFAKAVAADSTFGLAAIRGAQVASWRHHPRDATALIATALRSPLNLRHEAFARGYQHYLNGAADSSVAQLQHALALDSSSAFVWGQLAEVYAHLLPVAGRTDTLESQAIERAVRLDSSATYPLFHLVEVRLRRGDWRGAEPFVTRFLAAKPDTMLAREIEIMDACVRRGVGAIDWRTHVTVRPQALMSALFQLGIGGRHADCAAAGFAAILASDTSATAEADGRRWAALIGLQGIELARGHPERAERLIDAFIARWKAGSSLFMLDAWAAGVLHARADSVAAADVRRFGPGYAQCTTPYRCWLLALHLIAGGRVADAAPLADRILALPARKATREDSLQAQSIRAHILLARGDTAAAVPALTALLASGRNAVAIQWDESMSMGAERLALARVLAARGEHRRAISVLDGFDSPGLIHLTYLAQSLELRARSADLMGDASSAADFKSRLAAFRRVD